MSLGGRAARSFFSLPAAIFYCLAASNVHDLHGTPHHGNSALLAVLASVLLPSSIALWLLADAQKRRLFVPYDFGTFVFMAWPVLAPIYLFSTRGWRAFATLGWFLLLYLGAAVFAGIASFIVAMRQ